MIQHDQHYLHQLLRHLDQLVPVGLHGAIDVEQEVDVHSVL